MTTGPDDADHEDGRILSPEELDIADDDHVEEIDEGRYVVSPEVRSEPATGPAGTDPAPDPTPDPPSDAGEAGPDFSDAAVHEWLADGLADSNSRYGFDVTSKFDGRVSQQRMVSNDIVTVFESLMLWYARQVDGDTPVEEVLGILLSESNVPVRYPAESLEALLATTDLDRDDDIAALMAAVEDRDGVQL